MKRRIVTLFFSLIFLAVNAQNVTITGRSNKTNTLMRLFLVFFSFITSEYKTGMKKSVMKVELVKPPTTATPIGWTIPALPLVAKHIGSIPKIVVYEIYT